MKGLRCGEETYAPVVRRQGEAFEVEVGDRTFGFTLTEEAPGVFVCRDDRAGTRFHLAREGAEVHLFWDGVAYALEEEREGARAARRQEQGALEAPMPGRVSAVKVEAGQAVKKGEELLVVEAMKMENALRAPRDGVVRAVLTAVGEMVAPGTALVELETQG